MPKESEKSAKKYAPQHTEEAQQLAGELRSLVLTALNQESNEASVRREHITRRFYGEPDGYELPGRSRFVTREVMQTVHNALPSLTRVFLGSQQVVTFDPENAEDQKQASHETRVVNYIIQHSGGRGNYENLVAWLTDILLYPTAYIKAYVEDVKQTEIFTANGISPDELNELKSDPKYVILDEEEIPNKTPEEKAAEQSAHDLGQGLDVEQLAIPDMLYNVRFRETVSHREIMLKAIPCEQLLVGTDTDSLNLDEANFIAYQTEYTIDELVSMGFAEEDILNSNGYTNNDYTNTNGERFSRERLEHGQYSTTRGAISGPLDYDVYSRYTLFEIYYRSIFEGSDAVELRRIFMIGNTIFENEPVEYQPFVASACYTMPHVHYGVGLAETVVDTQLLSTAVYRGMLDNMRRANRSRSIVSRAAVSDDMVDQLQNPLTEYVIVNSPDLNNAIRTEEVPIFTQHLLPVIQDIRSVVQERSGVNQENNIDPKLLQNTTASAYTQANDKSNERVEAIIRNIAETGIKPLFAKVHYLLRSYMGGEPITINVDGTYHEANPAEWSPRNRMRVNVGLGAATKERTLSVLQQLLSYQLELQGMNLTTPAHIHNTLAAWIEASDMGAANRFFVDPESDGWQPPQPAPDPKVMEVERKQQEGMQKIGIEKEQIQYDYNKLHADTAIESKKLDLEEHKVLLAIAESEPKQTMLESQAELYYSQADQLASNEIQDILAAIKLGAETEKIRKETATLETTSTKKGDKQ